MDVRKLLHEQAESYPHKPALVSAGQSLSFRALKEEALGFAAYLRQAGAQAGDKIAFYLPNRPEMAVGILGSLSAGLTLVPLDFMLTEEEVVSFINHSGACFLLAYPRHNLRLSFLKTQCPQLKEIIVCGASPEGFTPWQEARRPFREEGSSPAETAAIFYTSGSTGHPKGVELSRRNLDNPAEAIKYFLDFSAADVMLCGGVPFSHIGGLDYILLMLQFAATLVVMERFQPYDFLKNIEKYKVSVFWIVPAMYVAIMSLKDYRRFDLSSLRYAVVFGAPSSPVLLRRFHQACPHAFLLNGWGMTETAAPNAVLPPGEDTIESVGRFTPWMEAKIVDEEGMEVKPGEKGELWVRGWPVMRGYYREAGLNQKVFASGGWLKTGDIAYCDRKGLFYIAGRKKDMIKVGGEIVFAAEVEDKIQRHPRVREAAVIGVPDGLRGEVPQAFVVAEAEGLQEEELRAYLKNKLAHFKMPHYFEFVKSLPKTASGKVNKQALKKGKTGVPVQKGAGI